VATAPFLLVAKVVLADDQSFDGRIVSEVVSSLLSASLALIIGGLFLDRLKAEQDRERRELDGERDSVELVNRTRDLLPSLLSMIRLDLAELVVVAYQSTEPLLDPVHRIDARHLRDFVSRSVGADREELGRLASEGSPVETAFRQVDAVRLTLPAAGLGDSRVITWVPDNLRTAPPVLSEFIERARAALPELLARSASVYSFVKDVDRRQSEMASEVLVNAVRIRAAVRLMERTLSTSSVDRFRRTYATDRDSTELSADAIAVIASHACSRITMVLGDSLNLQLQLGLLETDVARRLKHASEIEKQIDAMRKANRRLGREVHDVLWRYRPTQPEDAHDSKSMTTDQGEPPGLGDDYKRGEPP